MWHEIFHTFLESLMMLPVLFICYIIIELVETWTSRKTSKSLKGNSAQVLIGAGIGLIPQCGFGVVATDLFSKKKIRMGTLIAIYIATSDEAIPVILSNPEKIGVLLPLLLCKFVFALLTGYIVFAVEKAFEKKALSKIESHDNTNNRHNDTDHNHEHSHEEENHDNNENEETIHIGCCGHEIELDEHQKPTRHAQIKRYFIHPLLHTLYIFTFLLVVNLAFTAIIYAIGESNLTEFLTQTKALTPIFATIIGLIPNCAASVVLTNMYLIGSLPFGALIAGLIVNAGIAITVLFKQNKNLKQNLSILIICILTSLIAGYSLLYIV